MSRSLYYIRRWKWCALVSLAIVVLSLTPQIHFWFMRGSHWYGAYSVLQGDEILYSTYVNALIDGRPRRNDPFAGLDDHPQAPLKESLFSIQFVPPFAIAWLARIFGVSASTSFIVLALAAGLLASLSILWLFASVTGDLEIAAAGVPTVLCLGTVAAGHGLFGLLFKSDELFLGLLFLRRYEPAFPFPLFFLFCTLLWLALRSSTMRTALLEVLLAGVTLAILVFSYFYLWTAAVAWLVCVGGLWLILRPEEWWRVIRILIVAFAPVMVALAYYTYLLSDLPVALDKVQVLTFTHKPDFLRTPEIIGAGFLLFLIVAARRRKISFREPRIIFAASFMVLPFFLFNQQVITGRTIQPYHYEVFIANYVVLIGLVILVSFLQSSIPRRTLVLITTVCLIWGAIEVNVPFLARSTLDVRNDEMVPMFLHLKELARYDGTWDGLRNSGKSPVIVFSPETNVSRLLPTWAPQGTLLAMGSGAFRSTSRTEQVDKLYRHLYYCSKSGDDLRALLNRKVDDRYLSSYSKSTLFGVERILSFLGSDFQEVSQTEIDMAVRNYEAFVTKFSSEEVLKQPVSYVVLPMNEEFDFSHIDRWYERDSGESVGAYSLYRLKLRQR